MDRNQTIKLIDSLKEGQVLEINWKREVKVSTKKDGKKTFDFKGIIEDFAESIVPLKNKLWATPPISGKQKFYNFGKSLPKYDRRNDEIKRKIQKWTMAFDALKALDFPIKKSKWTDGYLKVSYDVEEIHGIKIYYSSGIPRYIESDGEKLDIPQLKPELQKVTYLRDVKE